MTECFLDYRSHRLYSQDDSEMEGKYRLIPQIQYDFNLSLANVADFVAVYSIIALACQEGQRSPRALHYTINH